MFKVVPDQLKISDGWVRCGHCADVFDATLYLEAWTPPAKAPAPFPGRVPMVATEPVVEDSAREESALERAPWSSESESQLVSQAPVAAAGPAWRSADLPIDTAFVEPPVNEESPARILEAQEPGRDVVSVTEVPPPANPGADDESDGQLLSESGTNAREQGSDAQPKWPAAASQHDVEPLAAMASAAVLPPETQPAPEAWATDLRVPVPPLESATEFQTELERFAAASASSTGRIHTDLAQAPEPTSSQFSEPLTVDATSPEEPGFVRQAKRQAFWRSPGVRAALGFLAVLLGLLLGGQLALHERDHLAASHPDLAPLLARLCEPLGCEIGPVQRIDAVVIDSSTLVRRLGNFYSFDLVLKNTAAMPVAVPALELSLTDSSDSVIARRVFLQQELPGSPRLLPAQGSLSLSLRLSITEVGAVSMAGYRALVFYP